MGDFALRIHHHRATVEYQFILSTDKVDIDHRDTRFAATLLEHMFALPALAGMEGRSIEVDEQTGAGCGRLRGRPRHPDIFADGDPDGDAVDIHHTGAITWREIALFIKDAVIGQLLFPVTGDDLPVTDDGSRVVQLPLATQRVSDDRRHLSDVLFQACQEFIDKINKVRTQKQVLRRIAGEGQLGEDNHVGRELIAGAATGGNDPVGIAVEVTDDAIQLRHDDAQAIG